MSTNPPSTLGLYRLALPDGSVRLARGDTHVGPEELLDAGLTIAGILGGSSDGLGLVLRDARGEAPVPATSRILAPVDRQEVWAAGVTYEGSRRARVEESQQGTVYDQVYEADRPELFLKATPWRVRGPGEPLGIRADSAWNVPEPELGLLIAADLRIAGYTIGNDMSSRSIEGENPLYVPQAKVYDSSCGLGPAIVARDAVELPIEVRLVIRRGGVTVFDGATSTARIHRPLESLVEYLGRALSFPDGAVLLTGTGVVPDAPFTLQPDDIVRIEAGPLGALENPVVEVGSRG